MVKGNNATFNYSTDRARIAELEAENAALREFVGVVDDVVFLMAHREDGDWFHDARQRLAAEHGLPLPEVER